MHFALEENFTLNRTRYNTNDHLNGTTAKEKGFHSLDLDDLSRFFPRSIEILTIDR